MRTQSQAKGKSKGGWTTRILALTGALGTLVRFVLMPGQRFDTVGVPPLIAGILQVIARRGARRRFSHRGQGTRADQKMRTAFGLDRINPAVYEQKPS